MRQRTVFLVMLLGQAALFAWLSRTVLLPGCVAAAAVAGWRRPTRAVVSRLRLFVGGGVAAAVLLGLWRAVPHERAAFDLDPGISSLLHAIGQWTLCAQAAALWFEPAAAGRPAGSVASADAPLWVGLPCLGAATLVSAGDVRVSELERSAFLAAAVGFALLCGAYFTAAGRGVGGRGRVRSTVSRRLVLLVTVLAVVGLTWLSAAGLRRYENSLDRLLTEWLNPNPSATSTGFTGITRLGSVAERKTTGSDAVALRVFVRDGGLDAAPGYLRGRAAYTLKTSDGPDPVMATQWMDEDEAADRGRPAAPVRAEDVLKVKQGVAAGPNGPYAGDFYRFRFPGEEPAVGERPAATRTLEVWADGGIGETLFLPRGTRSFLAAEEVVESDEHAVTISTAGGLPHYLVEANAGLPRPGRGRPRDRVLGVDPDDPRCLSLPPAYERDADLAALAAGVFAGVPRDDPAAAARAVESYFRRNYRYRLGVRIPPGAEPLRYFLLNRPPAHCEYFASGATVLLRSAGVRARYVTGFVAAERNAVGGFWVARNRDAHAWCEAWVPGRGWVTVEATPAAGVPDRTGGPSLPAQAWEALVTLLVTLRARFAEGGWAWLVGRAFTPAGAAVLVLLLAAAVSLARRLRRPTPGDPLLADLGRLLRRVDRRLARRAVVRDPGETLNHFGTRAAVARDDPALADWYARFAAVRYDPARTAADVDRLRATLPRGRPK